MVTSKKPDLLDWLCISKATDFRVARPLGAFFGLLLIIICLTFFVLGLVSLGKLGAALFGLGSYANDSKAEAIRNIGLLLVGLIGAPFLVWRSYVAQKQVNVAEQGQITDRINKAVEGLGAEKTVREIHETPRYVKQDGEWVRDDERNLVQATRPDGTPLIDRESYERTVPNLEVRIGAIYALERIAKDSLRDHIQIMEILCAYVRGNAPATDTQPDPSLVHGAPIPTPRADIQAAIRTIGRRSEKQIELEVMNRFRLDLRNCNLSGVDFRNGDFSAALFHLSRFEAANFQGANLEGSQFNHALLNYAQFWDANLKGTNFDYTTINKPHGPMFASIHRGKIYGISVVGADLSAIQFAPKDLKVYSFGSRDTKVHSNITFDLYEIERLKHEIEDMRDNGRSAEADAAELELRESKFFVDWAPFDSNDLAIGMMRKEFMQRLGLVGWPYEEN